MWVLSSIGAYHNQNTPHSQVLQALASVNPAGTAAFQYRQLHSKIILKPSEYADFHATVHSSKIQTQPPNPGRPLNQSAMASP